jgi:DNA helicase-2/ATP-dependent DNA helicase PcrA
VLTYEDFSACVREIPRFQRDWLNPEQENAVRAPLHPPMFIVAGPGTGKTTVLALRVLKLILVDGVRPAGVMATTFTRKAAGELRSRILAWGYSTINSARTRAVGNPQLLHRLTDIDINGVVVGTLDAIAEEFIADTRPLGGITPTTIEAFIARSIMRRQGLFAQQRFQSAPLQTFISQFVPTFPGAGSLRAKLEFALPFADRVRHDEIDLTAVAGTDEGALVLADAITDYFQHLENRHLADFARLEALLLQRLRADQLVRVTEGLQAILIDEFQDTNFLQEQIYFDLCTRSNGSLTVVGDDDQSIFRFRGATVELFANFAQRIVASLGAAWQPHRVDLRSNYRSTAAVIDLCNSFVQADPTFSAARVANKQPLVLAGQQRDQPRFPVLGMFRADCDVLATDLATFLGDVFRGQGRQIQCANETLELRSGAAGDFGDAVLLSRSIKEFAFAAGANPPRERLPRKLRRLLSQAHGVPVFNPRGRTLYEVEAVSRLLGLGLLCIDPGGANRQGIATMSPAVRLRLQSWEAAAAAFVQSNPAPGGLPSFVADWRNRVARSMAAWPREWPLLDLIFTLITWIPELQNDPEGQVYLEAIARTVAEVGQFAPYSAQILQGQGAHDARSVTIAIRNVFESVADGQIDVDEDVMPHVPRSYFPMMTIHQAKGLEFPLVIVDVGSDYRTNSPAQVPQRYPQVGDSLHAVEDYVAPFCPVGPARTQRAAVDRAWDDLRRLYYVSFSRAQNALLLVGLTSQLSNPPRVRSVATGDLRAGPRTIDFIPALSWHDALPENTVVLV